VTWQARAVAALLACLGCIGLGWRLGIDHMKASAADIEAARVATREAAQQGAADAIAKIQITNTTIRQAIETRVREVPVYRDCKHDGRVLDDINRALRGEPAGQGKLPD